MKRHTVNMRDSKCWHQTLIKGADSELYFFLNFQLNKKWYGKQPSFYHTHAEWNKLSGLI